MSLSNAGGSNGLQIATEGRNGGGNGGHTVNRYSSALAAVEADEAIAGGAGGWGNEDDDLFADEGFEPMETFEPSTPSPMPSFSTMKPKTAQAPLRPSTSANSSMSLGGINRTGGASARLGFGAMEDSGAGKFNAKVECYSFLRNQMRQKQGLLTLFLAGGIFFSM
jgi:SCY1-like protein 1